MSFKATSWALTVKGLKPATKIVLIYLADRHNPDYGCFPSAAKLAEDCEMTERSVFTHLAELERRGLIAKRSRTKGNGIKTSNEYLLNMTISADMKNLQNGCENISGSDMKNFHSNLVSNNQVKNNICSNDENDLILFEHEFWNDYPRKVGKKAAFKAWKRHIKNNKQEAPKIMLAYIDFTDQLEGKDEQFIPHLSTWINGERWKDGE